MLRHTHPALQNLPTTSRPAEVAAWIKNKKEVPPEVDPDTYGSLFMTWWFAIQPTWRLSDNALFVYEAPPDDYSVRVDLLASTRWLLLFHGGSKRCPCIFLAYVHGRPSETFNGSLIRSTTWSCIPPKESSEVAKILPSKPHSQTTPKGKFEHLYRFHQLIPQCRRREG